MARKKRKAYDTKTKAAAPQPKKMSRRDTLGLLKFFGIGAAVLGTGGYFFVSNVMAGIAEADLSKIGNGVPTIVQVHDPSCPDCRYLQGEARAALEAFEDGELQYLVANLQSPEGRRLAGEHGVGRVTLLLFDGRGRVRDVIQGRTSEAVLLEVFREHARRRRPAQS